MNRRLVIGLETHVQLLTRTKLFCGCPNQYGLPPNSAVCPVCLGLPGTLPVMNRRAFELSIQAALALNCRIAAFTKWDRKNYFYPDLPKNYQISQYDLPFSSDGYLEIDAGTGSRRIGILRAHLEEDAGKMIHDESGQGKNSLVDLNRTGAPLLEIVSRPELTTPEEAKAYLEELRLLLRELGISDCEMQEGSLRCDANVNVHIPEEDGNFAATPIVEIKNLNSFRGVERAIRHEAERQVQEYQRRVGHDWRLDRSRFTTFAGTKVYPVCAEREGHLVPVGKTTAGWDEQRGQTMVQRRKEEASDYRYFPEPDLVPVTVAAAEINRLANALGELPAAQRQRLGKQYGLSSYDVGVLVAQGRAFVAYFEQTAGLTGDAKETCNWLANEILQTLHDAKLTIANFPLPPASLAMLIQEVKATGLNKQRAREVYAHMLSVGASAQAAIASLGLQVVADEGQLLDLVRRAMAANPKAVSDYKKGKAKAADAIKGAIMRETKGLAKIEVVQALLLKELDRNE